MRNILFLIFIALSGCASMNTPNASLIDTIPVIEVGDLKEAPKDHIVFIPANVEFPIQFSLKGSVFNEDVSSTVMTSFKRDLYLYKYWASLDGKKWVNSHKLMKVEPSGGFDKTGGKVEVKINNTQ